MELDQDNLSKELGFSDEQSIQPSETTMPEPTPTIKVGNEELTQDQINDMVGFAKQVREAEKRYNTKFDRVWPAYGESQNRIKQLESDLESAKKPREEVPQDMEAQIAEAKKAAKQLGILTKDDLNELGIVTKADFDQYYRVQRATERLLDDANNLEAKIDGKDGRPAFKKEEILEYMRDTGLQSLELAYKIKHEAELDAWKESKLKEAKRPGMETMDSSVKPNVSKQPENPKVTRSNLDAMLQEALEGKI